MRELDPDPTHAAHLDARPDARPDVHVVSDGRLDPLSTDFIRSLVAAAAADCPGPVLRAHARLTRYTDPALPQPVVAQATINVNGKLVNARCAAATAEDASIELYELLLAALRREQPGHRRARAKAAPMAAAS